MAKTKATSQEPHSRPGLTPEAEENQCIALAMKLAKKRLEEGTASSQEVTHFLKLGSTIAQLQKEKLQAENELIAAKKEQINNTQRESEMYEEALNAFRRYSGQGDADDYSNVF
jgi:hypothetical protein